MKYLFSLMALFFLITCGKAEDIEKPQVQFLSPLGQDTISVGGDNMFLSFRVFDNKDLAHYSYVLKDSNDVKHDFGSRFINGNTYTHNNYVVFGGFAGVQELTLVVTAYDQAYNMSVSSRLIYVQP